MKDQAIVPPRKDVTHWRVRRLSEDRKKSTRFLGRRWRRGQRMARKELSTDTLRHRWGVGRYVIFWFGRNEEGQSVRSAAATRSTSSSSPASSRRGPSASEVSAFPVPPSRAEHAERVGRAPRARGDAIEAGAGDMSAMLQLLAFMDERQERHARYGP